MRSLACALIVLASVTACGGNDAGGSGGPSGVGTLWTTSEDLNLVRRVDSKTGYYEDIDLSDRPVAMVTGAGAVWVSTESSAIVRIDPAQGSIVNTIPVGHAIGPLAASSDAVWVIDNGDSAVDQPPSVHRIDPATNGVVASLSFEEADQPAEVVLGPKGVYVNLWNGFAVARIDPATNTIALTNAIGQAGGYGYGDLVVWGESLWVLDNYSLMLLELDPMTLQKKKELPVEERFTGDLIWVGDKLFVSDLDGEQLLEVDPTTAAVVREIDVGGRPRALASKGSTLLVGLMDTSGGAIVMIDTSTGAKIRELPGIYPDDIAVE
jgi:streptogramin lyase